MTGWAGDPPFRLAPVANLAADGANVTEIRTSAHIGTHIDAPLHCLADGGDVASLPLDVLCGQAIVVDVGGAGTVTVDDLQSAPIQPGDRVLLRTRSAGQPAEALRTITPEAAAWLVRAGVVLVGIDTPSPDAPDSRDLPVHRILLGAGIPIIENLDLAAVRPGRCELIALPLPIAAGEASPARVILRETNQAQT